MAEVLANGLRLHVQRIGSGPRTVVFLHGLVMDNLSSWYFAAATRVARHCDVVLYDLRGHGRSERPASGYRLQDMVDDLAALLDALEIDRPVALIGNSFGGLVALAFAARFPERVERIALIDAHVSATGWGEQMAHTLSLQGEERDRMIATAFADWLGRHQERKRNRLAENAKALVYGTSLVDDLRSSPPLTDEQLAGIECPVLALYGTESDVLDHGERLAATAPRCELQRLPGCSHSVLWEATSRVADQLAAYCRTRRFLFVVPPLTGHVNPTLPIAAELRRRGHEVAWAAHPAAVGKLLDENATVLALDDDVPPSMRDEFLDRAGRLRGAARLKFLFEEFFVPLAREMLPQVEAVVRQWEPDVIVADQQALAGGLAARRAGLPWASLSTTSAGVVNPFEGLPKVERWLDELLAGLQREAGLEPVADPQLSPRLALALTSRALIGEASRFPDYVRFVGPAAGERPEVPFPWERLDRDRRRLLVTLGTVNPASGERFYRAVRDGLADTGIQVIVVAPDGMIDDPPANFIVARYVPQLELLPRVHAVLCHAGHNTVVEALAEGLPLIVAPIKDDQPVVAQQVVAAGAGVQIRFGRAKGPEIRDAVTQVVEDASYRQAAARIRESLARAGGAVRAADLLETLC